MPFILAGKDADSKQVAFVESPIDALSLRELGFGGRIVATVGNSAELAKAKADIYRQQGLEVVGAFDNDKAGAAMCRNLGQHTRLTPAAKTGTKTYAPSGSRLRNGRRWSWRSNRRGNGRGAVAGSLNRSPVCVDGLRLFVVCLSVFFLTKANLSPFQTNDGLSQYIPLGWCRGNKTLFNEFSHSPLIGGVAHWR